MTDDEGQTPMTKVLVLYYSAYGHIEKMAEAVAEGARAAGAEVDIKRVPELVPAEVAKASYYKMDQAAPIATPLAFAHSATACDSFGPLLPIWRIVTSARMAT